MRILWGVAVLLTGAACGGGDSHTRKPGSCDGPCPASKIDHVVVIVQENHTFDNYFGTLLHGADRQRADVHDRAGVLRGRPGAAIRPAPRRSSLDDAANGAYDPNHTQACELAEIDGGAMDRYVTGARLLRPAQLRLRATAVAAVLRPRRRRARSPTATSSRSSGQSSSNDMYLARAQFVFLDNAVRARAAIGHELHAQRRARSRSPAPTIGDLLDGAGVSWAFYAEGYDDGRGRDRAAARTPAADCPLDDPALPVRVRPGRRPVRVLRAVHRRPRVLRDFAKLADRPRAT